MRKICRYGQSKQCYAWSMLLRDYIQAQFFLVVWAEFWVFSFRLILVAIGHFGFSIFTNPIFGCKAIFGHLKFIQILITKYAIGSLKVIGKFFYLIIPLFF